MSDERVDRVARAIYDELRNEYTPYIYQGSRPRVKLTETAMERAARAAIAALDEEPDHFYLATFKDVDDSQVTDTEPQYRRVYTIVGGPESSVLDARDSGWLSDEEWDRAVVLGFKGTRALAAYHDMESDEPTEDALDAESAQGELYERVSHPALYERVSHPALDEEPPLEDVPVEHQLSRGNMVMEWFVSDYTEQSDSLAGSAIAGMLDYCRAMGITRLVVNQDADTYDWHRMTKKEQKALSARVAAIRAAVANAKEQG